MFPLDKLNYQIISKISEKFTLEKCDIGGFCEFTYPKLIPITKYKVEKYRINGLGNMAVLQSKTLNIMSLLTVVLTPDLSKNMPFIIIDFVKFKNNYISFFEFFDNHTNNDDIFDKFKMDILKLKGSYTNLQDYLEKPKWYVGLRAKYSLLKHGNKYKENEIIQMIMECLDKFLLYALDAKIPADVHNSRESLMAFIEDLINKGNPSSKPIAKALGLEKSKEFFENIVFYIK